MKKLESSLLNMVLVLTGVAVIMGSILAAVNNVTSDPIAQQEKQALMAGIQNVMGGQEVQASEKPDTIIAMTDKKGKTTRYSIFNVKDADGNDIGVAVQDTVNGFGGPLVVLVGFDGTGVIKGYTILKHAETPGLGAKADEWFKDSQKPKSYILGRNEKDSLHVSKDNGDVEAITASTITSRAFLLAVYNAYAAYMQSKGEVKDEKACCGNHANCDKPCCKKHQEETPTETEENKEAEV